MFIESINNSHPRRGVARWKYVLFLVAPSLVSAFYPTKAQAQIVGDMVAKIPFEFHVGKATLPAGEYRVQVLDDSNLTVMEIRNMEDSKSVLFEVREADTTSTPEKSELIFNRYGNDYFLSKLFEEGSEIGSQVPESREEKALSEQSTSAQEHVLARRGAQRGN